jgi:hypothetical protein
LALGLLQIGQAGKAIGHLKAGLSADTDGSLYIRLSRAYRAVGEEKLAGEMVNKYQEIRKALDAEGVAIAPPAQ